MSQMVLNCKTSCLFFGWGCDLQFKVMSVLMCCSSFVHKPLELPKRLHLDSNRDPIYNELPIPKPRRSPLKH